MKELVLAFLSAAGGIAVFWFWKESIPLIIEGQFKQYVNFIGPVAGLIVVASLFLLSTALVKNKNLLYVLFLAGVAAPFLFLEPSSTVLGSAGICLFLIAFAIHRMRSEVSLSQGFSLAKTAKSGLHIYFTCAALIVANFYLVNIDQEQAVAALLPRATFNVLIPLFEKQSGIVVPDREQAAEVLYRATVKQFKELLGPYQDFLPYASAVIFFFAFKTFTIPLYYLALISGFLLIKLLIWSKIIKKETVEIKAERLTL